MVHSYGMCGATAGDWVYKSTVSCGRGEHHGSAAAVADFKVAPTWNIADLIDKHRPNLVIVEAADAMAGYGSPDMPKAWIYEQVRALTGRLQAKNVACVWVGPVWGNEGSPYRKTVTRVREMSGFLAQTVAPCGYVDSTAFARPGEWPPTDGQHLTPTGYQAWGQGIVQAIAGARSRVAMR